MKTMVRTAGRGALLAAGLMLGVVTSRANNLSITNVTVLPKDDTTAYVKFDIKWDHSWRYATVNHDAAWVFFKVLPDGQSDWKHVTLEGTGTNPTGYNIGTGSTAIEMVVPTDRVGMFVRRSTEGAGTTSVQNVKAVWNFASNSLVKTQKVKLQAFAVEMVYVAEGSFKVGDGSSDQGQLYEGGSGTTPFQINNAGPIECGNVAGQLWGASQSGNNSMGGTGTISNTFPNGYNAFYCMKYEITQGQYKDFLNALTSGQASERYYVQTLFRYTIAGTWPNHTASATDRACNYLTWADVCAFADWAGLRPMTELEFEKACRGPLAPVANEFAWGSTSIMADASRAISGTENGTETVTSDASAGGCNYNNKAHTGGDAGTGPLRVGIFATNGATRVSAGASYWGIMELSGNVWERTVTIGNATGRAFTGLHGDGILTTAGDANVSLWPAANASGAGFRGDSWYNPATQARVSDRFKAAEANSAVSSANGGRAVRSAP